MRGLLEQFRQIDMKGIIRERLDELDKAVVAATGKSIPEADDIELHNLVRSFPPFIDMAWYRGANGEAPHLIIDASGGVELHWWLHNDLKVARLAEPGESLFLSEAAKEMILTLQSWYRELPSPCLQA
jgi:hypothetical protein